MELIAKTPSTKSNRKKEMYYNSEYTIINGGAVVDDDVLSVTLINCVMPYPQTEKSETV